MECCIIDRGKGIGRVEWRVNDITAAVAAKPVGTGPDYAMSQQLALDAGDNIIEVVAYNASNLLASLAECDLGALNSPILFPRICT